MNFKKFLFGALSALALTACSNEDAPAAPDADEKDVLYATIHIQLPSASRSQTVPQEPDSLTNSNNGYEIGKNYENFISKLKIVLATKNDDGSYQYEAISKQSEEFTSAKKNMYTILFDNSEILKLAGKQVYIFAFCNEIDESFDYTQNSLIERTGTISSPNVNEGIWKSKNFYMTNALNRSKIPYCVIPSSTELITQYNSKENALNLGVVDVARVSSRFDFKPVKNNTYPIKDANNGSHIADVELVAMAPVNIAKEFYCLPRVSADGTTNNWTICGDELPTNYVVSPFAAEKIAAANANNIASLKDKYFYSTAESDVTIVVDKTDNNKPTGFWNDENRFNYTKMSYFDNAEDDNHKDDNGEDTWNAGEGVDNTGYKIWRYVTENTIPRFDSDNDDDDYSAQKTGISTGIVFKARIINPENETPLADAMKAKKPFYYFNGTFYGGIEALRETVAEEAEGTLLREAFIKVYSEDYLEKNNEGKFVIQTIPDMVAGNANSSDDATVETIGKNSNRFKIFRPDTDGEYYTYYVYRNRHNDNTDPAIMGIMEFGTVRNNIYKLSVTSISNFGHTANPGDDDDPEDPDDPDEDPKIYFKVSCHVLPWMVRVNNIEF